MRKAPWFGESLGYMTVRIETDVGCGTGFFYDHYVSDDRFIPMLVTNKHVVHGASQGVLHLHKGRRTPQGLEPAGERHLLHLEDFEEKWVMHPDAEIDLCAMILSTPFQMLEALGVPLFRSALNDQIILRGEELSSLSAVEDVFMIGYPNGLWDHVNNLPLVRRGITATHPAVNFQGMPVTVIDIAAFPGSSGSPVIIVDEEPIELIDEGISVPGKILFLGVLYAGPILNAHGDVEIREVPTRTEITSTTQMMMHLGYILKAEEVLKLGEFIKAGFEADARPSSG